MHKSHRKKKKRGKNHAQTNERSRRKENDRPHLDYASDSCDSSDQSQQKHHIKQDLDLEPYVIEKSDVMGRYLVASRDLEPGELIISAEPLVVGPCMGCNLICLGCYHPITETHSKCKKCLWPICSDACPGLYKHLGHSIEECSVLKEHTTPDYEDISKLKDCYQAIVPLRCLLLKSFDSDKWDAVNTMVAHNDVRRKIPELWKNNQAMVVDRIRKTWGLTEYDEEEIHTICGILEVNAFEVGQTGISIRGLYPRAYLLAHDCTPNTTHTDDSNRKLSIRASTNILKGEAITLSYAYTLQCTFKRREHLKESKFFDCACARCKDPTELNTYTSSIMCPKCLSSATKGALIRTLLEDSNLENIPNQKCPGIVSPSNPLDLKAPWKCNSCPNYSVSFDSVKTLIQRIHEDHDIIDANDIDGFETFLRRYKNVLHPNNYLCLSAKHSLSQLYGKVDSHLIHKMTLAQLERKRDICKDILKVFDVLEPGFSRLRGITLYELHAPLMILTTREFEKNELKKSDLRTRLKEVVECLRESVVILKLEPKESPEGIMATAAEDALKRIKDWEKIIGKI